jgi:hypothetical protein
MMASKELASVQDTQPLIGLRKGRTALRRSLLVRLGFRLRVVGYIWQSSFRSFLGHIEIQSAKGFPAIDFGPAFRCSEDGSNEPELRTQARSQYTEKLEAKYHFLDGVDIQMFLEGFDAGEQWVAIHTAGIEMHKRGDSA